MWGRSRRKPTGEVQAAILVRDLTATLGWIAHDWDTAPDDATLTSGQDCLDLALRHLGMALALVASHQQDERGRCPTCRATDEAGMCTATRTVTDFTTGSLSQVWERIEDLTGGAVQRPREPLAPEATVTVIERGRHAWHSDDPE